MRRGQNPRSQKPKEEVVELHHANEFCLLCDKLCKSIIDKSICEPCSKKFDQ